MSVAAAGLSVVSLLPLSSRWVAAVEGAGGPASDDPVAVTLTLASGWFDGEIAGSWGPYAARSYLRPRAPTDPPPPDRATRDAVLAGADVILGGFPVPVDLRARAPQLRWFHQTPAGASNLHRTDLWGSDVVVTTSRGLGNTGAIAEYTVAAFLHFARGFHQAGADANAGAFDRLAYRPRLFAGKTVCVVGVGGIGREVGRLCAALGATVVGTRRSPEGPLPEGFTELAGPDRLLDLLAGAHFVAVCAQWTPDTHGLIGPDALAALPDGAVLVNVARGEVVDEAALEAAIDRLGGVALDVYVGEFDHEPPAWLWHHPRVLITPHVSGGSDDGRSNRPLELFVANLRALLAGEPLANVVDWTVGY